MGNILDNQELLNLVRRNPNAFTTKEAAEILQVGIQDVNTAAQLLGIGTIGGRLCPPAPRTTDSHKILGLLTPAEIIRLDHKQKKHEVVLEELEAQKPKRAPKPKPKPTVIRRESAKEVKVAEVVVAVAEPVLAESVQIEPVPTEPVLVEQTPEPEVPTRPTVYRPKPPTDVDPRYTRKGHETWAHVLARCLLDHPGQQSGAYYQLCGGQGTSSALSAMAKRGQVRREGTPSLHWLTEQGRQELVLTEATPAVPWNAINKPAKPKVVQEVNHVSADNGSTLDLASTPLPVPTAPLSEVDIIAGMLTRLDRERADLDARRKTIMVELTRLDQTYDLLCKRQQALSTALETVKQALALVGVEA